jgi:endo-alpha-1,4-polygalactosaminidase (GH114 family)
MSDTAETDKLAHIGLCESSYIAQITDLARKLERELNVSRQIAGGAIQREGLAIKDRDEAIEALNGLIPKEQRAMKNTESVKQQVERVRRILQDSKGTIEYQIESENVDRTEDTLSLIEEAKASIKEYFSDTVQYDETSVGAIRRAQIRTQLLDFSNS